MEITIVIESVFRKAGDVMNCVFCIVLARSYRIRKWLHDIVFIFSLHDCTVLHMFFTFHVGDMLTCFLTFLY